MIGVRSALVAAFAALVVVLALGAGSAHAAYGEYKISGGTL